MDSTAPRSGERARSFARATVADAMHAAVLTCDPATPLGMLSSLDIARVVGWGRE